MSRRKQLEEMLQSTPGDTFLQYALAMECVSEGDNSAAVNRLRSIIKDDPDYVAAYFQAAQLLVQDDGDGLTEAKDLLHSGVDAAHRTGDQHAAEEMTEFLRSLPGE